MADGARRPVQRVDVSIGAAIGDDVLAGDRVDVRRGIASRLGMGSGEILIARHAGSGPPQRMHMPVAGAIDHDARAILLDESRWLAGRWRRVGGTTQRVVPDRAGRPIESVDVPVDGAVEGDLEPLGRVDVRRGIVGRVDRVVGELRQIARARIAPLLPQFVKAPLAVAVHDVRDAEGRKHDARRRADGPRRIEGARSIEVQRIATDADLVPRGDHRVSHRRTVELVGDARRQRGEPLEIGVVRKPRIDQRAVPDLPGLLPREPSSANATRKNALFGMPELTCTPPLSSVVVTYRLM